MGNGWDATEFIKGLENLKVETLNPDGTKTDITDKPELWFPKFPTDKKEIERLRLWKIINDKLNFHELNPQL